LGVSRVEVDSDDSSRELHYVIRTVGGARHAGWYRLLDEHQLQVISEGRCVTVPAASGSLEDQAREVLKEMATAALAKHTSTTPDDANREPKTS
jgi:hypothetical protein